MSSEVYRRPQSTGVVKSSGAFRVLGSAEFAERGRPPLVGEFSASLSISISHHIFLTENIIFLFCTCFAHGLLNACASSLRLLALCPFTTNGVTLVAYEVNDSKQSIQAIGRPALHSMEGSYISRLMEFNVIFA